MSKTQRRVGVIGFTFAIIVLASTEGFVSASHGGVAAAGSSGAPFTPTYFVNAEAYHEFLRTGTWADQTTLVMESRGGGAKGSINRRGIDTTFVQFYPTLLSIATQKGTLASPGR